MKIFFFKANSIHIYYPICTLCRQTITKNLSFWKLPLSVDSTNQNTKIQRNRLRCLFFPFLKYGFQINIEQLLNHIFQKQMQEHIYLKQHLVWICKSILQHKLFSISIPKFIKFKLIHKVYIYSHSNLNLREINVLNNLFLNNSKVNFFL